MFLSRYVLSFLLAAGVLFGGCYTPVEPPPGSACGTDPTGFAWLGGGLDEASAGDSDRYEPMLRDPALSHGGTVSADARFKLLAPGRQLVEVFLTAHDGGHGGFLLKAGDQVIDARYQKWTGGFRYRARGGSRRIQLLAVVDSPVALSIATDVDKFVLSAVRWTPAGEFERKLAPRWLKRVRELHAHPLFHTDGVSPTVRRHWLDQLYSRLLLSQRRDIRREALIGLARVWYWEAAENHEPRDIARAVELLEQAYKVAPDDPILRQTISASCARSNIGTSHPMPSGEICDQVKLVPWKVALPEMPSDAPAWAVSQIRLARRTEAITRWWVEQRQAPNGELGGGWGDDVEILRNWGPQALGFGSPSAARGLERIADGIWSSGFIVDGYHRDSSDVEHSSEAATDSQPLLAALFPDRPDVLERLAQTTACASNWIGKQPDGHWRFRSSWFNCHEMDMRASRAVDVHMNVRAMGPALWYAFLSRDAKTIDLLARWAESWLTAMRDTAHGKPAGIIPSAVRSSDGSYLIGSDRWDKPDVQWDYYRWSGRSQEALTSLFLALHDLTGAESWLDAATESFSIFADCSRRADLCAAIREDPESFNEWRRRSGDSRYDRAFGYRPPASDDQVLERMDRQQRETEQRLSVNFDMLTSEVLFTDRVYYRWPSELRQYLFGGEAPRGERYPTFSVTWPAAETEFARAVLEADPQRVRLRIYSFAADAAEIPVRLWRLQSGRCRWQIRSAGGHLLESGGAPVPKLPVTIPLPVPPRTEVTVEIATE